MTVRDVISSLSKLDLDKDIHISYDGGYLYFDVLVDAIADFDEPDKGVKKGDYIINTF